MRGHQRLATAFSTDFDDTLESEQTITNPHATSLPSTTRRRRDNESESLPASIDDSRQLCLSSIYDRDSDRPSAAMDSLKHAEDVPALPLHHPED